MPMASLKDNLIVAINADGLQTPFQDLPTPSQKIRRLFFEGQWVSPEMADNIGTNRSMLGAVVRILQEVGYAFETKEVLYGTSKNKAFRLENAGHWPTDEQFFAQRINAGMAKTQRKQAKVKAPVKATAPVVKVVPVVYPSIGSAVTVFLLHLAEDGQMKIGLRDGEGRAWVCAVTGTS